ncbi:MAG TPA: YidC/Oxa1 family membrane protein insertase [Actinomycetota bacterium]|nr:YidC/Oxa1 family membrane protein insertase [Actinomycetota bacterium]
MNPWDSFVKVFADVLQALAGMFESLGGHKWAAAIIVLTLILRTLLLPLGIKQIRTSQAMQRLKPEMDRLQKKYGKDRMRLGQEQQALFQREKVSPAGCVGPMIAQAPFLTAMYFAIRDLARTVKVMPFLGLGNLTQPAGRHAAGWLLLAIMTLTSIVTTKQLSTGGDAQQQKMMIYMMPLFFLVIMVQVPAGLVLYWAVSQLYQLAQQMVMLRRSPGPKNPTPQEIATAKPLQVARNKKNTNGKRKNQNAKRKTR